MKKQHHTAITEFEVIKPSNDMEYVGEKLRLSQFGEYCPDRSMRGYSLIFLLDNPKHYRVSELIVQGEAIQYPAKREQDYGFSKGHGNKFNNRPYN